MQNLIFRSLNCHLIFSQQYLCTSWTVHWWSRITKSDFDFFMVSHNYSSNLQRNMKDNTYEMGKYLGNIFSKKTKKNWIVTFEMLFLNFNDIMARTKRRDIPTDINITKNLAWNKLWYIFLCVLIVYVLKDKFCVFWFFNNCSSK